MHDLHEANKILNLIIAYAQKNKLKRVIKAEIELGCIIEHEAEISPENLEFNLKILAENTLARGLDVEIKKVKGKSWLLKEIKGF